MFDLKQDVYSVKEAFLVLKSYGLTKNEQIVRRWIRGEVPGKELKSIAPPNNATKIGYKVKKEDLEEFLMKHTKPGEFNLSNEKVTRTAEEEIRKLKQKIEKLEEENALLKLINNKSNEKSEIESIESKYEEPKISTKVKQIIISNDKSNKKITHEEIENIREKKYEEAKNNKSLLELTDDDYDRLLYTLASQFAYSVAAKHEIKMLKEHIDELELLAGQKVVKVEDRMVLKGLGVSIGEIIRNLPPEEETVRRLEITETSMDVIKTKFTYNKEVYTAEVQARNYGGREPKHWTVKNMIKSTTNRQVKETTVNKIAHNVIKKTFEKLYELERENNKSFYYIV